MKVFGGEYFSLVFSDEFNREGRTFGEGSDPRWTAVHKNDYTNKALQFYSKDYVSIETKMFKIDAFSLCSAVSST